MTGKNHSAALVFRRIRDVKRSTGSPKPRAIISATSSVACSTCVRGRRRHNAASRLELYRECAWWRALRTLPPQPSIVSAHSGNARGTTAGALSSSNSVWPAAGRSPTRQKNLARPGRCVVTLDCHRLHHPRRFTGYSGTRVKRDEHSTTRV
jgi:hypothetical protein